MIFTKESLKRSIRPIVVIVLACLTVWIWGNQRKVDIGMTLRPEIQGGERPVQIDMTIYKEGTEDVEAEFSTPVPSDRLAVEHLKLRPGAYFLRGIVSTSDGRTHIVTQTVVVPDDSADIEIYLREKN